MHNILKFFLRFDGVTKCELGPLCGLARGNPQCPDVLDSFSQSKHFDPIVVTV